MALVDQSVNAFAPVFTTFAFGVLPTKFVHSELFLFAFCEYVSRLDSTASNDRTVSEWGIDKTFVGRCLDVL
jgi:hypothetical protein